VAKEKKKLLPDGSEPAKGSGNSGTATLDPKTKGKTSPKQRPPGHLPMYKVLLHNDDKNDMYHVIATITALTPLNEQEAVLRTAEAHKTGVALLLVTHKERAELYVDQFQSKSLIVTIEPDE
jgi:ATP-dependent Clp protease adaptor protein ClpS